MTVEQKLCSRCQKVKPSSEFYQNKRRRDGLAVYCKKCESEYAKQRIDKKRITTNAWRQRNQEKIRQRFRERYANDEEFRRKVNNGHMADYYNRHEEILIKRQDYRENHREEIRAKRRAYDKRNEERSRKRKMTYYRQNKEQTLEYLKKWNKENKDRRSLYAAKRRAQKNGQAISGEPINRAEIIKRDNATCYICGNGPLEDSKIHLDHVIPLNRGGFHTSGNIRVACVTCNCKKQDKSIDEVMYLIETGLW